MTRLLSCAAIVVFALPSFLFAQGSLEECQYNLILAHDLGYADSTAMRPQLDEVAKILEAYAAAILAPNS